MTNDLGLPVYGGVRPPVSSRACSLFRAEPGAKSLFVVSGRGVKCYVPGPAGCRPPQPRTGFNNVVRFFR